MALSQYVPSEKVDPKEINGKNNIKDNRKLLKFDKDN